MWCEEINAKWAELIAGSPWVVQLADVSDPVISRDEQYLRRRLIPGPARTDRQVDLTLQLIAAFYRDPEEFSAEACDWAYGLPHPVHFPVVRAWMLQNLVDPNDYAGTIWSQVPPPPSYFRSHTSVPASYVALLRTLASAAFVAPAGRLVPWTAPIKTQPILASEEIIIALARIIMVAPIIDSTSWPMLWLWAAGGPRGNATLRTRLFAVQAIGAVARRGVIPVNAGTIAQITRLAQATGEIAAPTTYKAEREGQIFASAAASTTADIAALLAQQQLALSPDLLSANAFLPPGTPPPDSWPAWMPLVGVTGLMALLGGLVLWFKAPSHKALSRH